MGKSTKSCCSTNYQVNACRFAHTPEPTLGRESITDLCVWLVTEDFDWSEGMADFDWLFKQLEESDWFFKLLEESDWLMKLLEESDWLLEGSEEFNWLCELEFSKNKHEDEITVTLIINISKYL